MNRREALYLLAGSSALLSASEMKARLGHAPSDLEQFDGGYSAVNSREAALAWFQNAKFGLFMHYGLYSQLAKGEWVMLREPVPFAQYVRLKDSFQPDKFDANRIVSVAVDAGMKYVNLTSKHHEGFCLFRTRQTDYNSTESPSRRDLVGELAEACAKQKLGLFLYYSVAADWHHPWFCDPSAGWQFYRPPYSTKPPEYRWTKDADLRFYIEYVHHQLRELLTQYGPIAGIWFDPLLGYYARPDLFPMEELYAHIRSLQPNCLISFKPGATGTEDFAAPERQAAKIPTYDSIAPDRRQHANEVAQKAWDSNRTKPQEICDTMQPGVWGYNRSDDNNHRTAQQVLALFQQARASHSNLLLNTGLLPDGSIFPQDEATLRSLGKMISM